jgi:integrase/recombinase XerC
MLRHTYLKAVVDGGAGLHVAAALAGHSSLNTTAGYTSPGREDLEEAVRELKLGI